MSIRLQILTVLSFLCSFTFISCEQEDFSDPIQPIKRAKLDITYSEPPIDLGEIEGRGRRYQYADNLEYNSVHRRNKFDIFTLTGKKPTPLVIYIHAGGFVGGDKQQAYNYADEIREFLMSGIAFATINYRLLDDTDKGVITSLGDITRALQYLRYHAEDFNIDPNRISCFGVSAGAGSSFWLATHDDMANPNSSDPVERESSRITSAVSIAGQATFDIVYWETIFEPFGFKIDDPVQDQETLYAFYGINSVEEVYTPELEAYRREVDMLAWMDGNDAPLYIYNSGPPTAPSTEYNGDLYHHPFHAMAIDEVANQVGIEHQIYRPGMGEMDPANESAVDFTIRHLKK
ncbi:MAG: carboxylesterase family protein [Bacteroidota bacterium]